MYFFIFYIFLLLRCFINTLFMKRIIVVMVVAFVAALFVSCEKNATPSPVPSPVKSTVVRIDAEACADLFEMIDFTGSKFEFNGQTIDLSNFNVDRSFTVSETAKGTLTVVAKRKESFVPVAGKLYDAVALIDVSFNGLPMGCRKRIGAQGFSFESAAQGGRTVAQVVDKWCRRLSANYTFTINADGTISDSGR